MYEWQIKRVILSVFSFLYFVVKTDEWMFIMFMLALGVWTCFCDYFILDSCIVKAVVVSFSVWKQITRISGATVATRGRYLTEDELSRAEPGYTAHSVVVLCSLLVHCVHSATCGCNVAAVTVVTTSGKLFTRQLMICSREDNRGFDRK